MRAFFRIGFVLTLCPILSGQEPSFDGAAGFGSQARGGKGGRVIEVTRLDDDPKSPLPGSFRHAVLQKGARIVKFRVAGNLELRDEVEIREPFLTIDGRDAPGHGICLRGGTLGFRDSHDIIVRYVRVRLGDETTLRKNRAKGIKRPKRSGGLDCIELRNCHDAIFDHVSTSWSCDELFSVVHCRNVTVQWCLLAEPLSNPELHPYGDNHAFCFNSSADTLSVHHCLFTRYVMRGPQFEANDMRRGDDYAVQMEAVNNVMFGYQRSGSRYTTGVEDHSDEAAKKGYAFQFIENQYLGGAEGRPAIEGVMKHGVHPGVKAFVSERKLMLFSDTHGREKLIPEAGWQLSDKPLFNSSLLPDDVGAEVLITRVLAEAGCSHPRDAVDERVIGDVRARRHQPMLRSQADVGGWPPLE